MAAWFLIIQSDTLLLAGLFSFRLEFGHVTCISGCYLEHHWCKPCSGRMLCPRVALTGTGHHFLSVLQGMVLSEFFNFSWICTIVSCSDKVLPLWYIQIYSYLFLHWQSDWTVLLEAVGLNITDGTSVLYFPFDSIGKTEFTAWLLYLPNVHFTKQFSGLTGPDYWFSCIWWGCFVSKKSLPGPVASTRPARKQLECWHKVLHSFSSPGCW